jgi:hypothetical protein
VGAAAVPYECDRAETLGICTPQVLGVLLPAAASCCVCCPVPSTWRVWCCHGTPTQLHAAGALAWSHLRAFIFTLLVLLSCSFCLLEAQPSVVDAMLDKGVRQVSTAHSTHSMAHKACTACTSCAQGGPQHPRGEASSLGRPACCCPPSAQPCRLVPVAAAQPQPGQHPHRETTHSNAQLLYEAPRFHLPCVPTCCTSLQVVYLTHGQLGACQAVAQHVRMCQQG